MQIDRTMTIAQYLKALERLGLEPYAQRTGEALGLQARQIARLAVGDAKPSPTLKLLLEMYLRHGLP